MEKVRKKLEYESKPSNSDETIIAKKSFLRSDQDAFANFCGDFNPIHVG